MPKVSVKVLIFSSVHKSSTKGQMNQKFDIFYFSSILVKSV